jgi:hypothetical protein
VRLFAHEKEDDPKKKEKDRELASKVTAWVKTNKRIYLKILQYKVHDTRHTTTHTHTPHYLLLPGDRSVGAAERAQGGGHQVRKGVPGGVSQRPGGGLSWTQEEAQPRLARVKAKKN